jgi:acylaminoacyl-peptidase
MGLDLVSYLTPPADEPAERLPIALVVLGGPWGRDIYGYRRSQPRLRGSFVNYRALTEFVKHFVNAGVRERAGKMH